MNDMNPKVDFYFKKAKRWQDEYQELRKIVLSCPLTEDLKWGCPCYLLENSNVVLIHGFKQYCALLFFKGALLKDPKGVLIQQTKNVQASRQIRFTTVEEIVKMKAVLKAYIDEAIAAERSGLKVAFKKAARTHTRRISRCIGQVACCKNRLRCSDAWTAAGLHFVLLLSQTIQNQGIEN